MPTLLLTSQVLLTTWRIAADTLTPAQLTASLARVGPRETPHRESALLDQVALAWLNHDRLDLFAALVKGAGSHFASALFNHAEEAAFQVDGGDTLAQLLTLHPERPFALKQLFYRCALHDKPACAAVLRDHVERDDLINDRYFWMAGMHDPENLTGLLRALSWDTAGDIPMDHLVAYTLCSWPHPGPHQDQVLNACLPRTCVADVLTWVDHYQEAWGNPAERIPSTPPAERFEQVRDAVGCRGTLAEQRALLAQHPHTLPQVRQRVAAALRATEVTQAPAIRSRPRSRA